MAKDRVWLTSVGKSQSVDFIVSLTSYSGWSLAGIQLHSKVFKDPHTLFLLPQPQLRGSFPNVFISYFPVVFLFSFHDQPVQAICHCPLVILKTVLTLHDIITTAQAKTMQSYLNNQKKYHDCLMTFENS